MNCVCVYTNGNVRDIEQFNAGALIIDGYLWMCVRSRGRSMKHGNALAFINNEVYCKQSKWMGLYWSKRIEHSIVICNPAEWSANYNVAHDWKDLFDSNGKTEVFRMLQEFSCVSGGYCSMVAPDSDQFNPWVRNDHFRETYFSMQWRDTWTFGND